MEALHLDFYSMSHLKYIEFLKLEEPEASLKMATFLRVQSSSPVLLTQLSDGSEPRHPWLALPYLPSDKSTNPGYELASVKKMSLI